MQAISREPWHPSSNVLSQCRRADKHGSFSKIGSVFHKNEFQTLSTTEQSYFVNFIKQILKVLNWAWTLFLTIIAMVHNQSVFMYGRIIGLRRRCDISCYWTLVIAKLVQSGGGWWGRARYQCNAVSYLSNTNRNTKDNTNTNTNTTYRWLSSFYKNTGKQQWQQWIWLLFLPWPQALQAWVTRPEHLKGVKDKVRMSERPPTRSQSPESP